MQDISPPQQFCYNKGHGGIPCCDSLRERWGGGKERNTLLLIYHLSMDSDLYNEAHVLKLSSIPSSSRNLFINLFPPGTLCYYPANTKQVKL